MVSPQRKLHEAPQPAGEASPQQADTPDGGRQDVGALQGVQVAIILPPDRRTSRRWPRACGARGRS